MKAIGHIDGIGSLLIGAKQAGFEIVGNTDWRPYYHVKDRYGRNTFTENFPGAIFKEKITDLTPQEIERMMEADVMFSHCECGNYSRLSGANKNRDVKALDPADIPLLVEGIKKLKPRFFVADNLPGSFAAYPMQKYAEMLPDMDLFPEWVSNWGYGNTQKGRNRMFMLGALKSERWVFRPGEKEHTTTVKDILDDMPEPRVGSNIPNHDPHDNSIDCFRALNLGGYRNKNTWAQVKEYFADKTGGFTLGYERVDGSVVKRIGFLKAHWEGPAHVLTGGNASLHHIRCEPYTIRERARIQGVPDDFVFYGTALNESGEWNHDLNQHMVRQTGKFMPVQFAKYVSEQIAAHIQGKPFECSGARILPPNEYVSQAKQWYCENVGYADQVSACDACWLSRRCSIRTEKYGIGRDPVLEVAEIRPKAQKIKAEIRPKVQKKIVPIREKIETTFMSFGEEN